MNSIQRGDIQSSATPTLKPTFDHVGSLQGRSAAPVDEESQQKQINQAFRRSIIESGLKETLRFDDLDISVARQAVEKSLSEVEEQVKMKLEQWRDDLEKSTKKFEEAFKLLRTEVSPLAMQLEDQHKIGKQIQREFSLIEKVLDRPKEITSKEVTSTVQLIVPEDPKDLAAFVKPPNFKIKRCWFEEDTLFVTVTYECAKNSHPQFIAHWNGNYEEKDFPTVHFSLLAHEPSIGTEGNMERVEKTISIEVANYLPEKLITADEAKNKELLEVKHLLAKVILS